MIWSQLPDRSGVPRVAQSELTPRLRVRPVAVAVLGQNEESEIPTR
jgi:hypothetical protein